MSFPQILVHLLVTDFGPLVSAPCFPMFTSPPWVPREFWFTWVGSPPWESPSAWVDVWSEGCADFCACLPTCRMVWWFLLPHSAQCISIVQSRKPWEFEAQHLKQIWLFLSMLLRDFFRNARQSVSTIVYWTFHTYLADSSFPWANNVLGFTRQRNRVETWTLTITDTGWRSRGGKIVGKTWVIKPSTHLTNESTKFTERRVTDTISRFVFDNAICPLGLNHARQLADNGIDTCWRVEVRK